MPFLWGWFTALICLGAEDTFCTEKKCVPLPSRGLLCGGSISYNHNNNKKGPFAIWNSWERQNTAVLLENSPSTSLTGQDLPCNAEGSPMRMKLSHNRQLKIPSWCAAQGPPSYITEDFQSMLLTIPLLGSWPFPSYAAENHPPPQLKIPHPVELKIPILGSWRFPPMWFKFPLLHSCCSLTLCSWK